MGTGKEVAELRTPVRMYRPYRDRSGETLQAILIALLTVVVVVGFCVYVTVQNKPSSVPTVVPNELPQEIPTPSMAAPAPVEAREKYSQPLGPTQEQLSRYRSMQAYCYRMTQMNAGGEYPAFQQAACGDFARFAQSIGLSAGQLPDVVVKQPAPRQTPRYSSQTAGRGAPPAECLSLQQQRENVNASTRQAHSEQAAELYREQLRQIDARMWDLNCRNH